MATLPEIPKAKAVQSAGLDATKDAIRALMRMAPESASVETGLPPAAKPKHIVPFNFGTGTLIIPNTDKRYHVVGGKLALYTDAELLQVLQHYQMQVQAGWSPNLE